MDNNTNLDTTPNAFDSASFLNANHVLQLQDLFGQDQLDFDADTSHLYDEFTFGTYIKKFLSSRGVKPCRLTLFILVVPETNNLTTVEPSDLTHHAMETHIKRRRSSSSSSSSSCSSNSSNSSGSSSEEEEEIHDFSSIRRDLSDSSDDEQEDNTPYLHRRQMEELILDKITNHLDAEKLPGILTIISKSHPQELEELEEVEIDLAKLERDQLIRILSYVNACLSEKKGGPKVKLSDYTIQKKLVVSTPVKQNRRHRNRRKSSIVEAGHVVNGSSSHARLSGHGPISMSALTDFEKKEPTKKKVVRKRRNKKNNKDEDVSVHMALTTNLNEESIASTKPKRRSAIHKRRLLEEMLQPSNNESSSEEEDGIIVFGDEQMDLAVTQNETIVHQESLKESVVMVEKETIEEEEEDDELIDIMM